MFHVKHYYSCCSSEIKSGALRLVQVICFSNHLAGRPINGVFDACHKVVIAVTQPFFAIAHNQYVNAFARLLVSLSLLFSCYPLPRFSALKYGIYPSTYILRSFFSDVKKYLVNTGFSGIFERLLSVFSIFPII